MLPTVSGAEESLDRRLSVTIKTAMPYAAGIYFQVCGRNLGEQTPPIVLIHGAGGTHLYWPSSIRRLQGFRVYALDLPGHGKSQGGNPQSISAYTEFLQEWMGVVGIHQAVLVGHSMGSAIALTMALNAPTIVVGLSLLGAGASLRVSPDILENISQLTTFHKAVHTVVQWSFSARSPQALIENAERRMLETSPGVLLSDFQACNIFDETDAAFTRFLDRF